MYTEVGQGLCLARLALGVALFFSLSTAVTVDLTFALDASGSTIRDFDSFVSLCQAVVDELHLNISSDNIRVATTLYNEPGATGHTAVAFDFMASFDATRIKELLGELSWPQNFLSGYPANALKFIREDLWQPARGFRQGTAVVVLLSDGASPETRADMKEQAQLVTDSGGFVFALGIRRSLQSNLDWLVGVDGETAKVESLMDDPSLPAKIAAFALDRGLLTTVTPTVDAASGKEKSGNQIVILGLIIGAIALSLIVGLVLIKVTRHRSDRGGHWGRDRIDHAHGVNSLEWDGVQEGAWDTGHLKLDLQWDDPWPTFLDSNRGGSLLNPQAYSNTTQIAAVPSDSPQDTNCHVDMAQVTLFV